MAFEEPQGRPKLDRKAFHGIAGEILDYVEPHTEADPAGILATLLGGFSCMAGYYRTASASIEQSVNAWFIIMGETGKGRKGTATDLAERFLHHADVPFWEHNRTPSLSSGEGLIYAVRDGMDEDEIERRTESGALIDYGISDKRLLVTASEFAVVMSKAHGGTLGPVLRDAWDGKSLTIKTRESETATEPHITIIGHVTPEEFAARLKSHEMAGGTYNRFLPMFVHMTKELAWPDYPDDWRDQLKAFGKRLGEAVEFAKEPGEDRRVTFTPPAKKYYVETIYEEYNDTSSDSEMMKQFTTRRLPYVIRIAAIYALMNGRLKVSKGDLEAAKAVVDYAIESARYVSKEFNTAATPGPRALKLSDDRKTLLEVLTSAGPEGVSRTEIIKILGFRRSSAEITAMLNDVGADIIKVKVPGSTKPRQMAVLVKEEGEQSQ
ncbi:DUF3987 domain-containing protein [Streptomyces vinaceus]|uniref:DUF3987 domain-containing protein n=1 Tax=Streptomyces vinaceus TaxID=1960 RepID=UPI00368B5113